MASYIFAISCLLLVLAHAEDGHLHTAFTLVNAGTSTPSYPLPSMSWDDWLEKAPEEISPIGLREQYLLGRELRRRYDQEGTLNSSLLLDQVFIQMVDKNNSIASGQAFMRGFVGENVDTIKEGEKSKATPPFPVKDYFISNLGEKVLPMGVSTLPFHTHYPIVEDIFANLSCAKANNLTHLAFDSSPEVQNFVKKSEDKFLKIVHTRLEKVPEELLKSPCKYFPIMESILGTEKQYRATGLNDTELEFVQNAVNSLYFVHRAGDATANGYHASPVLVYMRNFFEKVLKSLKETPERLENTKAAFIFVEDRMMTSVLARLGFNVTVPMPGSSIVSLEVRGPAVFRETKELHVTLKYNDREIRIPGCSFPSCPYVDFLAAVKALDLGDPKSYC